MSFITRNISVILQTLVYRGREGQGAYLIHRVAGMGVLLFLALHIFDIFLIAFGPDVFNALLFIYKGHIPRLLETALAFGLLFHAINGLRIIVQDFYPPVMRYHRTLYWIQFVLFTFLFIPAATFMVKDFNVEAMGFVIIGGYPYGLLVASLLWMIVPLSGWMQNLVPAQASLNVSIAGGGK